LLTGHDGRYDSLIIGSSNSKQSKDKQKRSKKKKSKTSSSSSGQVNSLSLDDDDNDDNNNDDSEGDDDNDNDGQTKGGMKLRRQTPQLSIDEIGVGPMYPPIPIQLGAWQFAIKCTNDTNITPLSPTSSSPLSSKSESVSSSLQISGGNAKMIRGGVIDYLHDSIKVAPLGNSISSVLYIVVCPYREWMTSTNR
jgi:hypothetical protein